MKTQSHSQDINRLYSQLSDYENQLKQVEAKGYSWQETYYLSDKINGQIANVNSLIETYKNKRTHGFSFKPMAGIFSTLLKSYKWHW